jgi:Bacterial SH3 domain
MIRFALVYLRQWFLIFLSLGGVISLGLAASPTPGLTVRETGVILYSGQDTDSLKLTTLQKDEPLTLLAEAVGNETWYMVRTRQGLIGWLRASDAILSEAVKRGYSQELVSTSTWSAQTSRGPTYGGTWSVEPQSSAAAAAGTWTLQDAGGTTIFSGSWSAEKFSTGWNGVWRAHSQGSKEEYSGSWSADLSHDADVPFTALFEAAARNAVRGVWTGGSQSGTWSIRSGS